MFRLKLHAIACLGFAASLLLLEAHCQPAKNDDDAPLPSQDARKLLKQIDITAKLALGQATPKDAIRYMQVLEELAGQTGSKHLEVAILLHSHLDPAVRRQAAITLEAIGHHPRNAPTVVSHLIKGLDDRDVEVRATCFVMLGQMEHHAKPSIPRATEAMKDKDARIRRGAILTLGSLAIYDKDLIPSLVAALDDPDTGYEKFGNGYGSVSMNAMTMLKPCTLEGKAAIPKLVEIARKRKHDEIYQTYALRTLVAIEPEHPYPLQVALELLKDRDDTAHLSKAFTLLGEISHRGKPPLATIPLLMEILKLPAAASSDLELARKSGALSVLRMMGPAAKETLPFLRSMPARHDPNLHVYVNDAIRNIEGKK